MWSCFFLIASINLKIKYNTCGDNEQCPRCPRSKVQRKKYKEGANTGLFQSSNEMHSQPLLKFFFQ